MLRHGGRPKAVDAYDTVQVSRSHGPGRHTLCPTRTAYAFIYLHDSLACVFYVRSIETSKFIIAPATACMRGKGRGVQVLYGWATCVAPCMPGGKAWWDGKGCACSGSLAGSNHYDVYISSHDFIVNYSIGGQTKCHIILHVSPGKIKVLVLSVFGQFAWFAEKSLHSVGNGYDQLVLSTCHPRLVQFKST